MPKPTVLALWGFVLFLLLLIIYVSTGNRAAFMDVVRLVPGADKTGHFILMGLLAYLAIVATWKPGGIRLRTHVLRCSSIVAIAVTIEEALQQCFPNRTFSFLDLAASMAGIVVFALLAAAWLTWRSRI